MQIKSHAVCVLQNAQNQTSARPFMRCKGMPVEDPLWWRPFLHMAKLHVSWSENTIYHVSWRFPSSNHDKTVIWLWSNCSIMTVFTIPSIRHYLIIRVGPEPVNYITFPFSGPPAEPPIYTLYIRICTYICVYVLIYMCMYLYVCILICMHKYNVYIICFLKGLMFF